jgi:hypothetical protein
MMVKEGVALLERARESQLRMAHLRLVKYDRNGTQTKILYGVFRRKRL